jgi:phosphohistidine phosphatase
MIFLMRHADAVSDEIDEARPLSQRGRDQVARVCEALSKVPGIDPAEVWHSPLVRSRQTAELLVAGLGLKAPLVLVGGVTPDDDPARIAAVLDAETRDILVVSHEPLLGVLASLMVHGPMRSGVYYPFPKAGFVRLRREGDAWKSQWLVRSA